MHKPSSIDHDHEKITEQAAEWLIILEDDESEEILQQYQIWLAQDSLHQAAIDRIQKLISDVESVSDHSIDTNTSKKIITQTIQQQQKTVRHLKKSILSIAIIGSTCVLATLQYAPINYWTADQRNGSQFWQQHTLEDQSRIKISGKTAYNIDYTSNQRRIELLQGNILVDVAKDKARPFIVQTQHGTIQALGTRFIVTQDGQQTAITMLESKTVVWSKQKPQQKVEMISGQRLEINHQGIVSLQPVNINAQILEQAWQQRMLIANGDDLVDILDQLALYYTGKINFDRQELSNIKVTATLPLEDINFTLQQLAKELNLDIQKNIPYLIQIKKSKS